MISHSNARGLLGRFLPLATLAACLVGMSLARGEDEAKGPDTPLPEGVTAITQDQLSTKVLNFFAFDYPFAPQPGKRLWMRIDAETWLERYPDGMESRYKILGHAKVRDQEGTIVTKTAGPEAKTQTDNAGGFQVFIPDKGSSEMAILFRNVHEGKGEWLDMSWSLKKPTLITTVE